MTMRNTGHTGVLPDVIRATLEDLLLGEWAVPELAEGQQTVELHFATPWRGREVMTRQMVSVQMLESVSQARAYIGRSVVDSIARFTLEGNA